MDYFAFTELIKKLSEDKSISDTKKLAFLAYNLCIYVKNHFEVIRSYLEIKKAIAGNWSHSVYTHQLSVVGFDFFLKQREGLLDVESEYFKISLLDKKYKTVGFYIQNSNVDNDVKKLYHSSMELVLDAVDFSQNVSIGQYSDIDPDNQILEKAEDNLKALSKFL